MVNDSYQQFVLLFFLGFGLLLAAALNLALRQSSLVRRAAATLLAGGGAILACEVFEPDAAPLLPLALAMAAVLVPAAVLATRRGGSALAAVAERMARPRAPWWCCGAIGVAVIAGAALRFQERDDRSIDAGMNELETLEELAHQIPRTLFQEVPVELTTDRGTRVPVWEPVRPRPPEDQLRIENAFFRERGNRDHVIRLAPGDDRSNCYGWVFTGGHYWIPEVEFEPILRENGYREVAKPRPGDLVIYRQRQVAVHLAIVRYTTKGQPPLVEGKWGSFGTFLHAVDRSVYGTDFAYVRSPRVGHLLAGLPQPPDATPKADENTE